MSAAGPTDPLLARILASLREEVDPAYEFARPGPIPWRPAPDAARAVALVSTAGLHLAGDRPLRTNEERLGDSTFRLVPQAAPPGALDLAAPYVDRRYIPTDPEVALPRRALAALHRSGRCGPPAPRHASFGPGIVKPYPGLLDGAASLAELFLRDGVGAAILLPTCPLCVQTVCVLARELEARDVATVAVSLLPELSGIVGAPRTLLVRFPFGAPCGDPGNGALHQAVLAEAIDLFNGAREPGEVRASRLGWRRAPRDPAGGIGGAS